MRIDPHDFHMIAAVAPDIGKEVGRLASHRIGGSGGLQGIVAEPWSPRAIVVGPRLDRGVHRAAPLPRPKPGDVPVDPAGRA